VSTSLTLDMNCILDLELAEHSFSNLKDVVAKHDHGLIDIAVPAIAASERLPSGSYADNFAQFETRIRRLSERPFEIILPLLYLDITYFDHCIYGDEALVNLERKIHDVLFSRSRFRWKDEARAQGLDPNDAAAHENDLWKRWRNRKCDVLSMWCHIHYHRDIFVTRDGNFHKATKKAALIKLGANRIARPKELGQVLGV
jgi:hypothetical protein